MKKIFCQTTVTALCRALFVFFMLAAATVQSQPSKYSGPFMFENGIRKAKFLTVNFAQRAFDLAPGTRSATVNNMNASLPGLKAYLSGL